MNRFKLCLSYSDVVLFSAWINACLKTQTFDAINRQKMRQKDAALQKDKEYLRKYFLVMLYSFTLYVQTFLECCNNTFFIFFWVVINLVNSCARFFWDPKTLLTPLNENSKNLYFTTKHFCGESRFELVWRK